jgi:NADH-quinone oxidoreductase subunit G
MADESNEQLVNFTLDGVEMTAQKGELIIAAAERAGTYIPRFCYHPRMAPVGVCRMCLVEVVGPRGATLSPSCFLTVTEGMEVITKSEKVKKAQDGVLELLLTNHPLDCPVCDKGGECPLQDQTLAYGPGESRFVEEKRHFEKPIPISELVLLDRERCIQCSRCTRFADEVAGEALIDFAGRGERVEVATFPGEPFSSYFSGNTVQICPVGALTAKPYRFAARPWDLDQVESTCTTCSVGCKVAVQSSGNRLTRLVGLDADPVNHGWLCDKGRFGFEGVNGDDGDVRVTQPLIRQGDKLIPTTWSEALATAAAGIASAIRVGGAESISVIGGAQMTNEGAYAWTKLAKSVIGTDSVDAQLGDGISPELIFSLPGATIDEAARARVVINLAGDIRETLPVLHLRLRKAVRDGGTRLIEVGNIATSLTSLSSASIVVTPGSEADSVAELFKKGGSDGVKAARKVLADYKDGEGVVVLVGRGSLASDAAGVERAAMTLADALPKAKFLFALRRANVRGALEMGMSPGLLPGRVSLEEGRTFFTKNWPTVPENKGRTSAQTLSALAAGSGVGALIVLGADPVSDFPDSELARTALKQAAFSVVVGGHHSETLSFADVVFPAAIAHERSGTTMNLEGRITKVAQKLVPPPEVWSDVAIAVELAIELGAELDLSDTQEAFAEIAALAPSIAEIGAEKVGALSGLDGVVLGHGEVAPTPLDPMAFPGLTSADHLGSAAFSGAVANVATETDFDLSERPEPGAGIVRPIALPESPQPGSLLLVTQRSLYDNGALVSASPSLARLVEVADARLHPQTLSEIGAGDGARVRIQSAKGSATFIAKSDESVDLRAVVVDFNRPSVDGVANGAGRLIDASGAHTPVRVEVVA